MEIIVKGIRVQSPFERAVERMKDLMPSQRFTRELTEVNAAWFELIEKKIECADKPYSKLFAGQARKAAENGFTSKFPPVENSSQSCRKTNL